MRVTLFYYEKAAVIGRRFAGGWIACGGGGALPNADWARVFVGG